MKRRIADSGSLELQRQKALLAALSQDLALPLLQVKSSLEVVDGAGFSKKSFASQAKIMGLSVETGLQLIEAYRLVLLHQSDAALLLEPFAIGAVLEEVAHEIFPYAKEYSTTIEVDVQGRLTPVLADRHSLVAALQVLSSSMIRSQAAQTKQKQYKLVLGAHKGQDNLIAAGAFSNIEGLSDRALRAARGLVGRARQPLPAVPPGAASGILLADILCADMWQPLRAAAHRQMKGLATTVPSTKQLQFV